MKSKELSEKAMLVNLHISQWTARKHDRKISDKVAEDFGAESSELGRYNKVLIAQEEVKEVQKISSEARNFHYENTLPWTDEGSRILPSANFEAYSQKMRSYRDRFEEATRSFVENYPALIEDARIRLNGMFNPADYPNPFEIERKFRFGVNIGPLPVSEDFRVSLNGQEADKIKEQIETRVKEAQAEATKDLWQRLYEVVKRITDKLSEPDRKNKKGEDAPPIFRDSLIGNAVEICTLLPKLNINDDPELEKMRKEIESKLTKTQPGTLRENKEVREQTAETANDILNKMAGYVDISKLKIEPSSEKG
jgi:hypothetical protein